MPLKISKRPNEREAVADLKRGSRYAKHGQQGLAWHRGKMAGWIDAILLLQKLGYTRAAKRVQKNFGLNDDGSIGG